MRDTTSAPEPQAHGLPYQLQAESNQPITVAFNAKAAALHTYLLELRASGTLAMLPAFSSLTLVALALDIEPERLPRLMARTSRGRVANELGHGLGHAKRTLFHLKRMGFIAVIDVGGGTDENLYELLPLSAQARPVSAQVSRARKRAISAQIRVYKTHARPVTGATSAPGEGDTLLENVVVVENTNNTASTSNGATREDLERSVVVGALEEFGIWPDAAAKLALLPTTTYELARAAIIQAKAAKRIDNPAALAKSFLENPERITAGSRSKARAQISAATMKPPAPEPPPTIDRNSPEWKASKQRGLELLAQAAQERGGA